VSVNEKKWLVMHMHVQLRLDELRAPPNPWLTVSGQLLPFCQGLGIHWLMLTWQCHSSVQCPRRTATCWMGKRNCKITVLPGGA
jgi:hypothetical protein